MKTICLFMTLAVLVIAIETVYGDFDLSSNTTETQELSVPRFKRSGALCEIACARKGKSGGVCKKCKGYISASCGNGWVCVCKGVKDYCK